MGPVTPAMQSGWAPKTEKMKAAMNDDRSTSDTPYCCVVSMRSKENAMPGRTLGQSNRLDRDQRHVETWHSLCEEYEDNGWDDSIVPGICPVAGVVRRACANIANYSSANPHRHPTHEGVLLVVIEGRRGGAGS